jgi:hypothetical protein
MGIMTSILTVVMILLQWHQEVEEHVVGKLHPLFRTHEAIPLDAGLGVCSDEEAHDAAGTDPSEKEQMKTRLKQLILLSTRITDLGLVLTGRMRIGWIVGLALTALAGTFPAAYEKSN